MLLSLTISIYAVSTISTNPFFDVKKDDWSFDAINFVYQNNLMKGISDISFSPNTFVSRATIVTVLYRMENTPQITKYCSFVDVDVHSWYFDAVSWAFNNGIVYGIDQWSFSPDSFIKRQDLISIFSRYSSYKGINTESNISLSQYFDSQQIQQYALNPYKWAVSSGIIKGTSYNTLSPLNNTTRAELAQIIMNYCRYVDEYSNTYPSATESETDNTHTSDTEPQFSDTVQSDNMSESNDTVQSIECKHEIVTVPAIPATCTEFGLSEGTKCIKCEKAFTTQSIIPSFGHDYQKWVTTKQPTCAETGEKRSTCSICGHSKIETISELKTHSGGKATCKDKAVCGVCKQPYGELDISNHIGDFEIKNIVYATPSKDGYSGDKYCSGCNMLIANGEVVSKSSITKNTGMVTAINNNTMVIGGKSYKNCIVCDFNGNILSINYNELCGTIVSFYIIDDTTIVFFDTVKQYIIFDEFVGLTTNGYVTANVYDENNNYIKITIASVDGYYPSYPNYHPNYNDSNYNDFFALEKGVKYYAKIDAYGYYHIATS